MMGAELSIRDLIVLAPAAASLLWLGWWWVRHGTKGDRHVN